MESTAASNLSTTTAAIATATCTTTTTNVNSSSISSANSGNSSNITSILVSCNTASSSANVVSVGGASGGSIISNIPVNVQQQQSMASDLSKLEDANNSSLASAISESQRSLSGAPSASSSPILSPPGKMFGRNANGTMVATSRPNNEAEITLYRVLQRASLLAYYDTLLEMGGDDVQQLYEAGEEEFLEIMALVGMASKPLHVRRLQKALHEWASNPGYFQGPLATGNICDTPTKPITLFNIEPSPSVLRGKFPTYNPTPTFNPTPLLSTAQTSSSHLFSQICTPAITVPTVIQPHAHSPLTMPPTTAATTSMCVAPIQQLQQHITTATGTTHQVSSSSPQLTPVLTEMQVSCITLGAEKIARQLPQREPRAQTSKKRTSRELEQVIAMSEKDPRRMDEIRKYSAIYGRFDCKRRPEKPLTLHEVCVNEAAAQLCRLVPALLTRRDELFPLARQIVKDAGFGHSASIARYGGLLPQVQAQATQRSTIVVLDCESSDATSLSSKRQRLSSTDTTTGPELSRESTDDSRYNLFAMYQKFAVKPPFDLTELSKFSLGKSEIDDNDNDSSFSFSNSNSPPSAQTQPPSSSTVPMPGNGLQSTKDNERTQASYNIAESTSLHNSALVGGVQVLSAAGGHIIAVTNPALVLSPTLNEALSLKRETESPES